MKLAALLLALSVTASAQTNTGEITGIVRDVQGGALPGARVIAEHVDTGVRVEYPTDESGRYHLVALRVGMYVISVELQGFRRVVRSGVIVQLGQALNLDFTLDVGGPVEEIRVTASVPLLQTGSAEISDIIENQQVVQLPLNGRNFLALAQLSDAVVIPPGGTRGDSLQQAGPLPNAVHVWQRAAGTASSVRDSRTSISSSRRHGVSAVRVSSSSAGKRSTC
jgi:hypothetical protein